MGEDVSVAFFMLKGREGGGCCVGGGGNEVTVF